MSDGSFLERDSVTDGFNFAPGPIMTAREKEDSRAAMTQVIQADAEVQTKYVPYATASEEILMRRVQQLETILEEFGFQIPNRPFFLSREGYNNSDLLHIRHYFESGAVRPTRDAIGRLLKYHNSELSRLRQIEANERWNFMAQELLLLYKGRCAGVDYDGILRGKEERRRAEWILQKQSFVSQRNKLWEKILNACVALCTAEQQSFSAEAEKSIEEDVFFGGVDHFHRQQQQRQQQHNQRAAPYGGWGGGEAGRDDVEIMQYHLYREQQEWAEREERQTERHERPERQRRQQKRFVSPFLQVHERRDDERRAATASPRLGPPQAYIEARNAAAEANLVPETEVVRPGTSPSKPRNAHYDARMMAPDIWAKADWAVHGASLGGRSGGRRQRGKRAAGKLVPRRPARPAEDRARRVRTAPGRKRR